MAEIVSLSEIQPIPHVGGESVNLSELKPVGPPQHTVLGDLSDYWRQVNPISLIRGTGEALLHPIETGKAALQQNQVLLDKINEDHKAGDYPTMVRHGLAYFLNAIPGVGAALDQAADKAANRDYRGAVVDTAALATQIIEGAKLPGAAVRGAAGLPGAVRTAGKVVAAGAKAAAPDVAIGSLKAAGGALAGEMLESAEVGGLGRVIGAAPGLRQIAAGLEKGGRAGWEELLKVRRKGPIRSTMEGFEEPATPAAAVAAVPAIYDEIAQGFGEKSYAAMDEGGQATVRSFASRLNQPEGRPPAAEPPPPGAAAGSEEARLLRLEAARKAARPAEAAEVVPAAAIAAPGVPLRPAPSPIAPAAGPGATPVAPAEPLPVETTVPRGTKAPEAPAAVLPFAERAHPPAEAFQAAHQGKRAAALADRLEEHGITLDQAEHLKPESLSPEHWERVLGKDPETGVQYTTPSQETIDQARVLLAHKRSAVRSAPGEPMAPAYVTEDAMVKQAAALGLTEEEATAHFREAGYRVVGRAHLNRALHGLGSEMGLDHAMLGQKAAQDFGVKSMTQLSQDQLLEMYENLQSKRSISEPLVPKSAPLEQGAVKTLAAAVNEYTTEARYAANEATLPAPDPQEVFRRTFVK